MSEACYSFPSGCDLQSGVCQGMCRLGSRLCSATQAGSGTWSGAWGAAPGTRGRPRRSATGWTTTATGQSTSRLKCPSGGACVNGQCTLPCGSVEFSCPVGQMCQNGWCLPDPCDTAACSQKGAGWVCKSGQCIDSCKGVSCGPRETCVRGACVDSSCYTKGCPAGEKCVQGVCGVDPCSKVSCVDGDYCQDGRCLRLCDNLVCPADETCRLVERAARG